jgi:hypothetical protein
MMERGEEGRGDQAQVVVLVAVMKAWMLSLSLDQQLLRLSNIRASQDGAGLPWRPMEIETRSFQVQINLSQIVV